MTRILISAGGTGGGVYPALAVASALRQQEKPVTLYFVSSLGGIENDLVAKYDIQFDTWKRVLGGPLHGVNLLQKFLSILLLGLGSLQSLWILARLRPQVVFLTGGWASVPIAVAAWIFRIPVSIFVPDIEPARTLKLLGRFSKVITATVEDTAKYYPGKKVVGTGYPLRPELLQATRDAGIEFFGLDSGKHTLLVFGGSRGSRAINQAILRHLPELLSVPNLQILHISGKLDAEAVQTAYEKLATDHQTRYHIRDYVHEMGLALAVADLVICRAGASTLGEFPAFELPAILIPLAYEWHYQEINADWLASKGAAIRLDETDIDSKLVPLIHDLFQDDEHLEAMSKAAKKLKQLDGTSNIAHVILSQTEEAAHDRVI